jgi:hypothetical protein
MSLGVEIIGTRHKASPYATNVHDLRRNAGARPRGAGDQNRVIDKVARILGVTS